MGNLWLNFWGEMGTKVLEIIFVQFFNFQKTKETIKILNSDISLK